MKFWITALFSLLGTILIAQPSNDDCGSAIDLGTAPYCEDVYFTNVDATASNIGVDNLPPCWDAGTVQRDVWFSFIASDTILDYSVTVTGESNMGSNPMLNPQVAVYRGDCGIDELFFFDCFKAISGENALKFSMTGLTPGATYWLRIADYPEASSNNAGTFKLCIEKKSPITNIIEGFSKECEGQLVDSGGPDEDYGPNETYIFTICPEFPSACIDLTFIYYHLDFLNDEIVIYDGPDDNSPIVGTITGTGSNPVSWGGVCKRFTASSGCMTIKFTSNDAEEFEGFLAEWKCSPVPCKVYDQPTIQNQFTESEILNTLSSSQTIVTFDTLICAQGAYGLFFGGDQTDLGLNKGILLTTGSAQNALGPNDSGSSSGVNGTIGDDDLDVLSDLFGNGTISNDACILELDVYANTNELTFEYVFGSEEYPEFVNSNFNDIFAFLISGPGITGIPQIGGQDNMAVLPNGTFVQINSVNHADNWEYYRDNLGGQSIEYDGLTS
ncbi:MAG TPA: choice-of-anchor L domain-containing protein, partial [Saprospiraceae bacterium]|nr:choice-of-anchor L domain-containing protein [Saprospiraceae bacterium]